MIRDIQGYFALHHAVLNDRLGVVTAMMEKTSCLHVSRATFVSLQTLLVLDWCWVAVCGNASARVNAYT